MPRTCPVGLLGLLTHSSFGVADESVGPAGLMSLRLSIGWGVAPASLVPTSYVGYARAGNPTTSPRPAPCCPLLAGRRPGSRPERHDAGQTTPRPPPEERGCPRSAGSRGHRRRMRGPPSRPPASDRQVFPPRGRRGPLHENSPAPCKEQASPMETPEDYPSCWSEP